MDPSARSNSNVRSMGQNLWSNSPERGQQKSLTNHVVHAACSLYYFQNKKKANLSFLKRMLAQFFYYVSYSRLSSNGFYFNFRLCESENKYWLEQIKLFPVEVGQVMTDRP